MRVLPFASIRENVDDFGPFLIFSVWNLIKLPWSATTQDLVSLRILFLPLDLGGQLPYLQDDQSQCSAVGL